MKLIRTAAIPNSINTFCRGLLKDLRENEGYDIVAVASPGDKLNEVSNREGVRTIPVKIERRISPIKDIISLFRLIKVFRREKPDIVHSMTPKAGMLSMMAAWMCRVPVRVHTFTGLVFPTATGITQKILILTDRITCACATHIIPEGEGVKNDLIAYKITKKPLKVLGHGNVRGIDLERYDPSLFSRPESSPITFIFIGRLVRDKGINELVSAFAKLNKEYNDTRLLLVGCEERNLDPLDAATIAEIGQNPAIETVGYQADVRPWIARAHALVFPSYREGFPNVVIEAGAMGLPSIVTDINGSREIIIDGQNGIIVKPRDEAALLQAMRKFVENPDIMHKMGLEARPLVASRYEQGFVRQCLKDFYKEILK